MRHCLHCRTDFKPKRSDARFCSNLCREAAHRMRKKDAEAASAAVVVEQRKAEGLRVLEQLDAHELIANVLHAQAKANGIDVRFMPAASGVIAVEGRAGAFRDASAVIARFPYLSVPDYTEGDDRARSLVMTSKEIAGASVIAREAAAECREAASRGGNVYELRAKPDYIADRNRAARLWNDGAKFLGLKGFRCRCGHSQAGSDSWTCCGDPLDTDTPDAPRGFPHPRTSSRYG
jgi:hypothetical protein